MKLKGFLKNKNANTAAIQEKLECQMEKTKNYNHSAIKTGQKKASFTTIKWKIWHCDIVITKNGKDGAAVIINIEDYISEAES